MLALRCGSKPAGGRKTRGDKSAAPAARDESTNQEAPNCVQRPTPIMLPKTTFAQSQRTRISLRIHQNWVRFVRGFCQGKIGFVFSNAQFDSPSTTPAVQQITNWVRFFKHTNHPQRKPQTRHPARI
jgi:hypothetical protein